MNITKSSISLYDSEDVIFFQSIRRKSLQNNVESHFTLIILIILLYSLNIYFIRRILIYFLGIIEFWVIMHNKYFNLINFLPS